MHDRRVISFSTLPFPSPSLLFRPRPLPLSLPTHSPSPPLSSRPVHALPFSPLPSLPVASASPPSPSSFNSPFSAHLTLKVRGKTTPSSQIVNHARDEAASYLDFNGGPIPGSVLCDRVSGLMHAYTLYWYVRPFGASVLIANYAEESPELYAVRSALPSH